MISAAAVLLDARRFINDTSTEVTEQRYSDADLTAFLRQAIRLMAILRPDIFTVNNAVAAASGAYYDAPGRLIEVYSRDDGRALVEVTRETMDQNSPTWRNDTAADGPTDWVRDKRRETGFWVHPQFATPAGRSLLVAYVDDSVAQFTGDSIALDDRYTSPLTYLVVYFAETINEESTAQARAAGFMTNARDLLGLARSEANTLSDETGGMRGSQNI